MTPRHSESDACDCPPCLRHYRQRTLWLASIWTVLAATAIAQVLSWLIELSTN